MTEVVAPPTGDTQAPAPAAAVSPGQGTQTAPATIETTPADWTSSLNDDLKGFAQNKGYKDPAAVLESYRNLEKLLGADKATLLKIPQKEDDPAWKEVYEKLGVPKEAKEYEIKVREGVGDEKFAEWAKNTFHELGIPKKQAEKLAEKYDEQVVGLLQARQEQYKQAVANEEKALRTEWGAAFEQNKNIAKRGAAELGINDDMIDKLEQAMGFAGTVKFLHSLGAKMGEPDYKGSQNPSSGFGILSPQQAQSRIQALKQDADFVKRYTANEANARMEMDKLYKWAYPDA